METNIFSPVFRTVDPDCGLITLPSTKKVTQLEPANKQSSAKPFLHASSLAANILCSFAFYVQSLYFYYAFLHNIFSTYKMFLWIGLLHELHTHTHKKKHLIMQCNIKILCEKVLSDPGPALASRYSFSVHVHL